MVQVLRSNADHVRLNRMQRAQQRGNTISLKILFPTILCLAPAAFIVILSPPLLELRAFRDREKGDKGALNKKGVQNIKPKDSTGSPAGL
jgi:pilus assembly protein TadC